MAEKNMRWVREPIRINWRQGGFPSGSVVKNPPANAGDVGSIPDRDRTADQRRSRCRAISPCSTIAGAHTLQSLCSTTEVTTHHTREQPPLAASRESPHSNQDPTQPKNEQINFNLKKKESVGKWEGKFCYSSGCCHGYNIAGNKKEPHWPFSQKQFFKIYEITCKLWNTDHWPTCCITV